MILSNISTLTGYTISVGILFFCLFGLHKYCNIIKNSSVVDVLNRTLPLLDLIAVVLFLKLSKDFFLKDYPEYHLIFVVFSGIIILWFFKSVLLDITAGLILVFVNHLRVGTYIFWDDNQGIIHKINLSNLVVKLEDGNLIFIPYTHLSKTIIKKTLGDDSIKTAFFNMTVTRPKHLSSLLEKIHSDILLFPWSVPAKKPKITATELDNRNIDLKITIYAMQKSDLSEIESALKKRYATGS